MREEIKAKASKKNRPQWQVLVPDEPLKQTPVKDFT
jgi:hypothetical protein